MNKGTIIEDAIAYTHELKKKVEVLTGMLQEMEVTSSEEEITTRINEIGACEEMKRCGIKVVVEKYILQHSLSRKSVDITSIFLSFLF